MSVAVWGTICNFVVRIQPVLSRGECFAPIPALQGCRRLGSEEVKWKTTIFRKLDFLQEKLALRGSLAVTWLTVYRQLQYQRWVLGWTGRPGQMTRRASTVTRRARTVCLYSDSNTGAGSICRQCSPVNRSDFRVFVKLVLKIPLWDFDARLQIDRYMYNLDSYKGACRLKCLARRTTRPKHRTDDYIFEISFVFKKHNFA